MNYKRLYVFTLLIFISFQFGWCDNTVGGEDEPIEEDLEGDINSDGKVNVTDLVILIKKLNNPDDASLSKYNCDLTGNNVVDKEDLTALKNLILNANN